MENILNIYFKYQRSVKKLLFLFVFGLAGISLSQIWVEAEKNDSSPTGKEPPQLLISQGSTLMPLSNPNNPEPAVIARINAVITAYSSTPWQTDDTPFITASGSQVKDGIIANNYLPFGTKVRIPTVYGDKIFTVEDRMHWQKSNYNFDVWFADYWQALNFGAKRTYIEVLEG